MRGASPAPPMQARFSWRHLWCCRASLQGTFPAQARLIRTAILALVRMNLRSCRQRSWSLCTARSRNQWPSDQRCLPCMQLMTNFLAGALLPPISLSVNPRVRASETHRLKLSLIDSLASARDAFAASVLFFCANTTVDVTTLTTSAVAATARIGRIAFLPLKTLIHTTLGLRIGEFHYASGRWAYRNVVAECILV
jgi:hypothetical protein